MIGLGALYCALAFVTVLIVQNFMLMAATLVVIAIFAFSDIKQAMRGEYWFRIKRDGTITLSHLSAETCYPECRMYYNRWCMVMKLKNSEHANTLLLTPDRFEDESSYARARHHLMRLKESTHAA